MQTRLHLVSMPWADPNLPSIQTAVLKAYVDSVFGSRVKTSTYSAFASIPLRQTPTRYIDDFDRFQQFDEYPYFLICFRRFLHDGGPLRRVSINRLIARLNDHEENGRLTLRMLDDLERRSRHYVEEAIVPRLSRRCVNLVGFTLNYYQLYASIYCARHLGEAFPDYKYVFLFGGATVIYPKVAQVLRRFGIQGVCVIGEGERKLELIVGETLEAASDQYPQLVERLGALHEGIYDIQNNTLNLYEADTAALLDLQTPIEKLPLPNFDEYYTSLRKIFDDDSILAERKAETWMALEGTRGCFAKCDFCDVHTSWRGFRKNPAEQIVANVLALARKYRIQRIKFMDNVCDTWAERYAEILVKRGVQITSFMECRVHHSEDFWTKLSLSGVVEIQIGIEAFSPGLLRAMAKGTRARQNLLVQKWLKELRIESLSNLISHHPKSTLQHVRETRRILRLIPHLDRLNFSNLALLIGSPLDRRLDPEERRQLTERQWFQLPNSLNPYFVLTGEYEAPTEWYRKGVFKAWDELIEWENEFFQEISPEPFMSSTRCGPEEIIVSDGRYGEVKQHYLEGDTAQVYHLCHRGPTLAALIRDTELPPAAATKILSRLIEKKLLVELDGAYIALAVRPRDELIHNYHESVVSA